MTDVQTALPPPPPTAAPSKSAPRDDERRKQQERDRRRSQQRPAPEVRNRPAETSGRAVNWLKRETPFKCDVKFRNDLPEVPCEPKLLVDPLNASQLAAFKLTSLERDPKRELLFEPDLGIPLSVFDIERYSVPAVRPPLAPEDLALLEGDDEVATDTPHHHQARNRLRGSNAELSWLMRTTYISNEMTGSAAKGIGEKAAKAIRDAAGGTQQTSGLEHQIAHIEAGFAAAQQPPVHQKNPSLQPVEILPVLPDEERWPDSLVQVVFDGDEPTADVPHIKHLKNPEDKRRFTERSVLKSYKVTEGDKTRSFLTLMVPQQLSAEERSSDTNVASDERELSWVREYDYKMLSGPADQDFVFFMDRPGIVSYCDMAFKLVVKRRDNRKHNAEIASRFERPSQMWVRKRPRNEADEAEREVRRRILSGEGDDEYEAEAEEQYAGGDEGAVDEQQQQQQEEPELASDDATASATAAAAATEEDLFGSDSD